MKHKVEYKQIVAFSPDRERVAVRSPRKNKLDNLRQFLLFLWAANVAVWGGLDGYLLNRQVQASPAGINPAIENPNGARVLVHAEFSDGANSYCNGTSVSKGKILTATHCFYENTVLASETFISTDSGKNWEQAASLSWKGDVAYLGYDEELNLPTIPLAPLEELKPGKILKGKALRPEMGDTLVFKEESFDTVVLGWLWMQKQLHVIVGEPRKEPGQKPAIVPGVSGTCLYTEENECAAVVRAIFVDGSPEGRIQKDARQMVTNFGFDPDSFVRIAGATLPQKP